MHIWHNFHLGSQNSIIFFYFFNSLSSQTRSLFLKWNQLLLYLYNGKLMGSIKFLVYNTNFLFIYEKQSIKTDKQNIQIAFVIYLQAKYTIATSKANWTIVIERDYRKYRYRTLLCLLTLIFLKFTAQFDLINRNQLVNMLINRILKQTNYCLIKLSVKP